MHKIGIDPLKLNEYKIFKFEYFVEYLPDFNLFSQKLGIMHYQAAIFSRSFKIT